MGPACHGCGCWARGGGPVLVGACLVRCRGCGRELCARDHRGQLPICWLRRSGRTTTAIRHVISSFRSSHTSHDHCARARAKERTGPAAARPPRSGRSKAGQTFACCGQRPRTPHPADLSRRRHAAGLSLPQCAGCGECRSARRPCRPGTRRVRGGRHHRHARPGAARRAGAPTCGATRSKARPPWWSKPRAC